MGKIPDSYCRGAEKQRGRGRKNAELYCEEAERQSSRAKRYS
jgi:hypothetical protein